MGLAATRAAAPMIPDRPTSSTTDAAPAGRPSAALAAGGALVAALFFAHALGWQLMADDAFILFRHVDHWVTGSGLVYNPGERVEGYSSVLWAALLALPARLGASLPAAALVLGLAAGLATLALVFAFAVRRLSAPPAAALAACALLAAHPPFSYWAAGGLETPLFALLLVALAYAATAEPASPLRAPPTLFGLAALLALTRPEGAAAGAALAATHALGAWRDRRALGPALAGLAVFVAVVGAHEAARLAYYGEWLSNPSYAKVSPSLRGAWSGVAYLGRYARDAAVPFLLPVAALAFAKPRGAPARALAVLGAIVAIDAAFIVAVGGDGLYQHRFLAHVAPLVAAAGAPGLALAAAPLGRLAAARPATARLALVLAALALLVPRARDAFHASLPLEQLRRSEARWSEIGRALDRAAPPGLVLATNVAGRLPFFARRATIDLLGLCDRTIARAKIADPGAGYAGHEKADPAYVLERAPDLLYVSVLDGPTLVGPLARAAAVARLGATPLHRYAPLFAAPAFGARYRPATMRLASGERARVFVRLDGAAAAMPREALEVQPWADAARDEAREP